MLLAEFFAPLQSGYAGAMDAYSNMGRLCGLDAPPRWIGSAKPDWSPPGAGNDEGFIRFLDHVGSSLTFRNRCRNIVRQTPLREIADDDRDWRGFLLEGETQFREACKKWREDYDSLREAWVDVQKQPPSGALAAERAKASSIRYQLRAICDITVIEWFSDAGFLPRYGFPIHLQRLSVRKPRSDQPDKSTTAEGYRLERTSLLALNEYVPGALVLVGGRVVESRGILKHWTEANRDEALGLNNWALCCLNGHDYLAASSDQRCKECNEPPQCPGKALMFPRFGYTTAAWDPPKAPGRNLDRVGEVVLTTAGGFALTDATEKDRDFGGIPGLMASYYEAGAGELLIRNAGGDAFSKGDGFALCTRCGFAMSEEKPTNPDGEPPPLPKEFRHHPSVFSTTAKARCWPKSLKYDPVLRHKVLAAKETTDALILDWPGDPEEAPLFSLGRALVLAGAQLLELDSRELSLELKARDAGRLGILLHDTTPGGAGQCLELFHLGRPWLEKARSILRGTPLHDAACRRACLECLLDFAGQFHADRLDRRRALEVLDEVLGD
jgi:hypothetical protein